MSTLDYIFITLCIMFAVYGLGVVIKNAILEDPVGMVLGAVIVAVWSMLGANAAFGFYGGV